MKVKFEELTREQLEALVRHLDSLSNVLAAAHDALMPKLAEAGEVPDACKAVLYQWAEIIRATVTASNAEIGEIVSPSPTKLDS